VKVEGLITVRSSFGHGEMLARFEAAIRANGMSIVARVDHADGVLEISVSLDATTLLMFGHRARQAEARPCVSVHRHGRDDRRHRKKRRVAALAA